MIDRDIVAEMQAKFSDQFEHTSSSRFRRAENMQYAFSYYHFIIEEHKWPYEVDESDASWLFVSVSGDVKSFENQINDLQATAKKFICLNDEIDYSDQAHADLLTLSIANFYQRLFPQKSTFEL